MRKAQVTDMKQNKGMWIAAVVMIPLIVIICMFSINKAKEYVGVDFIIAGKAELRNTIEIPLSQINELDVSYTSKNIKVYSGDSDKIVIKEYLLSSKEDAKAECVIKDGKAQVTGKKMSTIIIFGGIGEKIEVYLPKEGLKNISIETKSGNITAEDAFTLVADQVDVQAVSGNIKWQDTQAKEINVSTVSGNIHCNNIIAGEIALSATSGNIDVEKVEGVMEIATSSGGIDALGVKGYGDFSANSGSIKVETDEVTGNVNVQTSSGNVKLLLPKDLSFSFEAETGSGNIHTDFDDKLSYNKKGNHATGVVGEAAEIQVSAKANSGSVKVLNK